MTAPTANNPTLNIYLEGSRTPLSQIVRIEEGMKQIAVHFRQDGSISRDHIHEAIQLVERPQDADLIYLNNPPYSHITALRDSGRLRPNVKIIFNVLDLPLHLLPSGYNPMEHYYDLKQADAVTSPSLNPAICRAGTLIS